ncbi:class I SAM-dependent methyltransferase [Kytococcus sedentarius]|uniref:class I SAM-dependent methyltransferase n=1 Tax=Kytococcus sedentarius TaxID=1276 RepID=UPI0035BC13E9
MRPVGDITRGTTAANRLRRVDRWLVRRQGAVLRSTAEPLVVDLGFGALPLTTVETFTRVRAVAPRARVIGLEIDAERVAAAAPWATEGLEFRRGGFELAGLTGQATAVRAFNVLRQYPQEAVPGAWELLRAGLAPDGVVVEGTSNEMGRRAVWVTLDRRGPQTLTFSWAMAEVDPPSAIAERLPKVLIHHNVPGQPVHALLGELDAAWHTHAHLATWGRRQRFVAAVHALAAHWPVVGARVEARRGELTVPWEAVAPV